MDPMTGLLDAPRAHRAFVLRSSMVAPWSIEVRDEAPLTVVALVRGRAWILSPGSAPVLLEEHGVAVLRGPEHYVVADEPGTAPQVTVLPGQRCVPAGDDRSIHELGVRTWGNAVDGETVLLTGTYQLASALSQQLLSSLPRLAVPSGAGPWQPVVRLLAAEVDGDQPGQDTVLDRLLDLLLVTVLRTWFTDRGPDAPGWFRAHADPVVGPAVRALLARPEQAWTVAELAAESGVSRATLARTFHDLVGQPPMEFLRDWRLTLAADLLRQPGTTVAAVARRVGYASPFSLSTAFRRERGVSPQQHRNGVRQAAPLP